MLELYLESLENMLKELSLYERKGLDTSSLRIFMKNLRTFIKLQKANDSKYTQDLSFEDKLTIIRSFLEDKKVFPKIKDIINFGNEQLSLDFKDQKEARDVTIRRILGRIIETPELKEKVKMAVISIRNQKSHSSKRTKKEIDTVESFSKWAEILKNL